MELLFPNKKIWLNILKVLWFIIRNNLYLYTFAILIHLFRYYKILRSNEVEGIFNSMLGIKYFIYQLSKIRKKMIVIL